MKFSCIKSAVVLERALSRPIGGMPDDWRIRKQSPESVKSAAKSGAKKSRFSSILVAPKRTFQIVLNCIHSVKNSAVHTFNRSLINNAIAGLRGFTLYAVPIVAMVGVSLISSRSWGNANNKDRIMIDYETASELRQRHKIVKESSSGNVVVDPIGKYVKKTEEALRRINIGRVLYLLIVYYRMPGFIISE